MCRDRIEYRIYHHPDPEVSEGTIPLDRVERIYVSYYVAPYHYAYRKSKFNEHQPVYHILPMINVVYREETDRRVLGVPFFEYFDAEQWLKELQSRDIPIWATAVMPSALPKEEQLPQLEDESNSRPFPFHHHLQKELEQLVRKSNTADRGQPPVQRALPSRRPVLAIPQGSRDSSRNGRHRSFLRFYSLSYTFFLKLPSRGALHRTASAFALPFHSSAE
ncbi:hypothetical protein VQ056_09435 [Paenibacillus sp. JTLBN-2024]